MTTYGGGACGAIVDCGCEHHRLLKIVICPPFTALSAVSRVIEEHTRGPGR